EILRGGRPAYREEESGDEQERCGERAESSDTSACGGWSRIHKEHLLARAGDLTRRHVRRRIK
ncbi:hypothetical protein AB4Z54_45880, partial [Streptomyces sp. MCAF7]